MKTKLSKIIISSVLLFTTFIVVESCAVASLPSEPMNFSKLSEKGLLVGSITFPTDTPNLMVIFSDLPITLRKNFR